MRPAVTFLDKKLIENIISEAISILGNPGVEIQNEQILELFAEYGTDVDFGRKHVCITEDMIEKSLKTVPGSFELYDVLGNQTHDFSGRNIHFTPGSSAMYILDNESQKMRKPDTADYIKYAKIINQLNNIASQSTAFIPADVHENISDSYRLFLSLLYCEKPVITGTFSIESFDVMKDMQIVVRGTEKALKEKPLTVFSCCPASPLKWSEAGTQNLIDCARYSIPAEIVPMPLAGFISPVTLVGTIIQHTAEILSGIAIHQLVNPGAPLLWGGSPAIFDIRYQSTPMGAIETMMIDCANNEIGKHLGVPTQAYMALSDAKKLDSQAGMETGMGAVLAALSGINNISGPGMLNFENCQSLEKLVLDNEICGMMLRLSRGIEPKEDFPALPIFQELLRDKHLMISEHTFKHIKEEHYVPGNVIDRTNNDKWTTDGGKNLAERANEEVEKLITNYCPSSIPFEVKKELIKLMEKEADKFSGNKLPHRADE